MLLGNLGADPELRFTQAGQAVLHLRLATKESYLDKDKQRQERTDWHNVVVWGKRGEALGKILAKGSSIFIEGSLRTSSYDNREGVKVYKTEVIANNVILAGGKGQSFPVDAEPTGGFQRGVAGPTRDGQPRRGAPSPAPPADFDQGGGFGGDDDIPF